MEGALAGQSEAEAAIAALDAGCDLILYPSDPEMLALALEGALAEHRLDPQRIQQSLRRRQKWAQWASPPNEYRRPAGTDVQWGAQLADRVLTVVRGAPAPIDGPVDVLVVEDDAGGPYPAPPRDAFFDALILGGADVRRVDALDSQSGRQAVIALFGDIRAWKGRPGYSADARGAVEFACSEVPYVTVMQFSHPRLASEIPAARNVVSAWGGDAAMQQAAARWLLRPR
jgi:beta-glucosidase